MSKHPETDVIHVGDGARETAAPLTTPIYSTTTFVFANAAELEAYQQGKSGKYIYSRYANPTVQAAEQKLASLECAERAIVTSSGMAAITTALFGLLQALRAQNKTADAALTDARFKAAWARADVTLPASRFGRM